MCFEQRRLQRAYVNHSSSRLYDAYLPIASNYIDIDLDGYILLQRFKK